MIIAAAFEIHHQNCAGGIVAYWFTSKWITVPATAAFGQVKGVLFFHSNIQFASFFQGSACTRQFISQLNFSWLCQVKTEANKHHTQWSLPSPPLLCWLQVQSLHLKNIHHSCFYTPTWWQPLLYRHVTLFPEDNNGFVFSSSTIALNGESFPPISQLSKGMRRMTW